MKRVKDIAGVRRAVAAWRRADDSIAFVPTMGALHRGHLSLVERARQSADRVVVSIFVNPLQFGPHEDLARYPRPIRRDRALLAKAGVDLLWEPAVEDLYGKGDRTRVRVEGLDQVLEGAVRPGHFTGVATVVARLLNVVQPDVLWLGQKDGQQVRLLEQMVHDLRMPVKIRRGPTVREKDGLALSSRNAYLSPAERGEAIALAHGLEEARAALMAGERSAARLISGIRKLWKRYPRVREDYVAVVDAGSLEPVRTVKSRVMIAVAARLGRTRLIDNFEWEPK
jgi:pantoate--beta-alanine ligase